MAIVTVLTKATSGAVRDLNLLMAEVRNIQTKPSPGNLAELKGILSNKQTFVIVAKDDERIVGVATLFIIQKIGKRTAYVEDVVVDSTYRGQGLGEKIMRKLIAVARNKKVMTISLTSRPARTAANKLYQKLGFVIKETNPYRLKL